MILHDPQTAGMVKPAKQAGVHIVWRCHIGCDVAWDADGVGVVVASGAIVEVSGPGVGSARVGGEVGDSIAEWFIAGTAETDGADLAGLSGRWCGVHPDRR